ncbi:MAG: AAA family ATPase [Acidobacteriota bacterium]|nr:AAA family ATPase [Acidobacteriota bacterium]
MEKQAHAILNKYLASEPGRSLSLPDPAELNRQRDNFLALFGPERLASLSGPELLRKLPYNITEDQPMDYWLEFKNDDTFNYQLFGSISGGSSKKFGVWQEKAGGTWQAKQEGSHKPKTISEDEALEALKSRRDEILSAVRAVEPFQKVSVNEIDPTEFQKAVETAAPQWHHSVWLHKYLHLYCPERVTWNATLRYLQAHLYRVGVVPITAGPYALDIQSIQFWNSLPAPADVPEPLRYRLGKDLAPRDHWGLGLGGAISAWKEMLAQECLSLGPDKIGDLSEVLSLSKKRDISLAVDTLFQEVGLHHQDTDRRNLVELVYRLKEGSLVALFSDRATVVAVGEVTGAYRYRPGGTRPHQVPVRWYHTEPFETGSSVNIETNLRKLDPTEPVVADIESFLLGIGVGPWPNFNLAVGNRADAGRVRQDADRGSIEAPHEPLLPLEGIARQVVEMLERKRQVILYGPPGTGKTYHAENIALEVVARQNYRCLPSQLSDRKRDQIYGRTGGDPFITTTTFHPMYSYEDFIEGYRPDGNGFKLDDGIFKRMVIAARAKPDRRFVLIIDEINRGNIPKIFGELITLLEVSKRGKTSAWLPLSKKPFTVPDNLLIIGTMNTADRSILLLDTALRRRFAFKELMPEPNLLRGGAIGDITLGSWLRALNRRIVEQLGRDGRNLQVGHAYLMPGGKPAATAARIGEIVRDELWPLLQEYCYEDPNKLANILAADKGGIYNRETADLRFDLFEANRESDLVAALKAIVTPDDKKHEAVLGEDAGDDEDMEEDADGELE